MLLCLLKVGIKFNGCNNLFFSYAVVSVVSLNTSNFATEFSTFRTCFTLSAATGVNVIVDVSIQPETALRMFILLHGIFQIITLPLSKISALADYVDEIQRLNFPTQEAAGIFIQCFDFLTINNEFADGDRTVSLVFSTSSPRVIATPMQIIIVDDECK